MGAQSAGGLVRTRGSVWRGRRRVPRATNAGHPVVGRSVGRRRVSLARSQGAFGGMCFPFHISEPLISHLRAADLHKRGPMRGGVADLGLHFTFGRLRSRLCRAWHRRYASVGAAARLMVVSVRQARRPPPSEALTRQVNELPPQLAKAYTACYVGKTGDIHRNADGGRHPNSGVPTEPNITAQYC